MAMKKRTKVTSSTTEKAIVKEPVVKKPVAKEVVKEAEAKETAVKETAAKTPAAKETAVKETVVKASAAKAPAAKETTEKKQAVKKQTAKKEIKVKAFVEYYGKQVEEKDMIANVKKAWTKSGKKVGDIKTMELYIKPEEAAVYYVINGTETGAVAF